MHFLLHVWGLLARAAAEAGKPRFPCPQALRPALLIEPWGVPRPPGRHRALNSCPALRLACNMVQLRVRAGYTKFSHTKLGAVRNGRFAPWWMWILLHSQSRWLLSFTLKFPRVRPQSTSVIYVLVWLSHTASVLRPRWFKNFYKDAKTAFNELIPTMIQRDCATPMSYLSMKSDNIH